MKRKGNRYSHKAKIDYVVYDGTNKSAVFSLIGDYTTNMNDFEEVFTFDDRDGRDVHVHPGWYICLDHWKQIRVCN